MLDFYPINLIENLENNLQEFVDEVLKVELQELLIVQLVTGVKTRAAIGLREAKIAVMFDVFTKGHSMVRPDCFRFYKDIRAEEIEILPTCKFEKNRNRSQSTEKNNRDWIRKEVAPKTFEPFLPIQEGTDSRPNETIPEDYYAN